MVGLHHNKLLKKDCMKSTTLHQFKKLERQLDHLLHLLHEQPQSALIFTPGPGKWSALQVLEHLLLTERATFQYLKKKAGQGIDQLPGGWIKSKLRGLVLLVFLRLPFKIKAPGIVDITHQSQSLQELEAAFRILRTEMNQFLEQLPNAGFRVHLFKHPLVGRLRLTETFLFLSAHFERHHQQIVRALKAHK